MRIPIVLTSLLLVLAGAAACAQQHGSGTEQSAKGRKGKEMAEKTESVVLGGGCFWCIEAVFERIDGVQSVVAGYAGGHTDNPTYSEVSTGGTGHAEVAKITFDPSKVSLEELLNVFWQAHDPTTLNRQGADVGTQYRSIILYADEAQRTVAERSKMNAASHFRDPIVTEIVPLRKFYLAEDYHQDYFNNNRNAPYCRVVIEPKLKKLSLE
jgi:peptide-methionine (S)-S-oxide reductase